MVHKAQIFFQHLSWLSRAPWDQTVWAVLQVLPSCHEKYHANLCLKPANDVINHIYQANGDKGKKARENEYF
jgi:hypothetical protein